MQSDDAVDVLAGAVHRSSEQAAKPRHASAGAGGVPLPTVCSLGVVLPGPAAGGGGLGMRPPWRGCARNGLVARLMHVRHWQVPGRRVLRGMDGPGGPAACRPGRA